MNIYATIGKNKNKIANLVILSGYTMQDWVYQTDIVLLYFKQQQAGPGRPNCYEVRPYILCLLSVCYEESFCQCIRHNLSPAGHNVLPQHLCKQGASKSE